MEKMSGKKERELVDFTSSLLIYLYAGEIMGLKIVYGKSGTGKKENREEFKKPGRIEK